MAEQGIDLSLTFNRVSPAQFRVSLIQALEYSPYHKENVTLKDSYEADECWLGPKGCSGFAVTPERELISVFSCAAGGGRRLLTFAKAHYDFLHLNCYNTGYLRNFYQKNGFRIVREEANWTPGQRDVLFMCYQKS